MSTQKQAAQPRKMRIGFVGTGFMGQRAHLSNYVTLPDCEVVALAELRPDTGRLVAARYGIPKVYRTHDELLSNEQLDGVVASQPFDVHAALLPELYGRVKCVFTEKPVAVSVAAGEQLAKAAAAAGTVHMVGYHKRSDPATQYAREVIDGWRASGEVGRLRYVRITMPAGDWVAGGDRGALGAGDAASGPIAREEATMTDLPGAEDGKAAWGWKEEAGRYVGFVNYYIHQVNYLRHMFGEPYRVVFADRGDTLLVAESASGITGIIEMSPYNTSVAWEETILVGFERGYVKIALPAPLACNRAGTVEVYRDPGNGATPVRTEPTLPWVHAMRQQAINFVRVCRGEIAPPCTCAEAVEDLRMAREYIRLRYGK